jgi:hypothetical protein
MQSSKLPRKKSKSVENVVDSALPDKPATATSSRSVKLKPETAASVQSAETIAPKRHRSTTQPSSPAAAIPAIKQTNVSDERPASVVPAAAPQQKNNEDAITDEMIARLAHSYWVERGHGHGSAEEDWFRAERQLRTKAAHA